MDKSPKEILAELYAELSALKARVGEIEKKWSSSAMNWIWNLLSRWTWGQLTICMI